MITVDKSGGLSFRVSNVSGETRDHKVEFFLFLPGELHFSSDFMNEDTFYQTVLSGSRTYYTYRYHLPLVHSRLASRDNMSSEQYRLSLSLFAFQFALSLEKTSQRFKEVEGESEDEVMEQLEDIISLSQDFLRRLRRYRPKEEKLKKYYANIDNYLSWFTEQCFLSLLAHMPRSKSYGEIRQRLVSLCEDEIAYRAEHRYNSEQVQNDSTRLTNKMRLLRRLIEYPITIRERQVVLGNNIKKVVKGIATAFIMVFVTLGVTKARHLLGEITLSFLLLIAGVYALREVFKDDLRDLLWSWIRKGRPRWRKEFLDSTSGAKIGRQLEWLDYSTYEKLPDSIRKARRGKVTHREETVVCFKTNTQMAPTKFLSGYDMTREIWQFDLRSLSRLMDRGAQKIYQLKDGQVSRDSIEKRHQLNLIIRETDQHGKETIRRWKINVNRSKVVDIEEVLGV
ncbi:hypothetical protein NF212_23550 [Parasalinivibrio latis]|uniref:hypothetical protein n=1 Tax=Parasalinivibrio latis TaxID=2952610 RepID=UPI0030DDF6AA